MSLRINQNPAAMTPYRNLSTTDAQMSKSLEKLSSGLRINKAADDAAGLAVNEGLRAQGGLKAITRNAQDEISAVQTAQAQLSEVNGVLQRMTDLAKQGADPSASAESKNAAATEYNDLVGSVNNILGDAAANGASLSKVAEDGSDFSKAQGAIDKVSNTVMLQQANLTEQQNKLEATNSNLATSESRMQDVEMEQEMAQMTKNQILSQSSVGMLSQANQAARSVKGLLE